MKILVLSPGPHAEGGAERSALILVAGLVERGHDVAVAGVSGTSLAAFRSVGASTTEIANTRVEGVEVRHGTRSDQLRGAAFALPKVIAAGWQIRRAVSAFSPDVVLSNGARTHILSSAVPSKIPVVWALRDVAPSHSHSRLLTWSAKHVRLLLANSHFTGERYASLGLPVEVVWNPVASGPQRNRQESQRSLGLSGGRKTLLIAAHLHPSKGIHVALEALDRWPVTERPLLLIAGGDLYQESTSYRHRLMDLVERRGLRADVRFLGLVDDLSWAMSAADVFVHPALHAEGFGRSVIEAQGAGLPVVATDLGGVAEVCEGGVNAVLVPPNAEEELAAGISSVLSDKSYRDTLTRNGRVNAQRFLPAPYVESVEQLLMEVAPCE